MKILKLLTATTALVLSTSVNAAIISADWQTAGDNLITHDTESGLNWLDLTETNTLTYNYVNGQLGTGGQFAGYRYATSDEVVQLWTNFGVDLTSGAPYNSAVYNPGIAEGSNYLGNIMGGGYPYGVRGMVSDELYGWHYYLGAYTNGVNSYYDIASTYQAASGTSYVNVGSYLVQTSVVPVPAAVWLFGSGLIGLFGFARRKKA